MRYIEIDRDTKVEFDVKNGTCSSPSYPESPGLLSEASAIENGELRRTTGRWPPCSLRRGVPLLDGRHDHRMKG